jgi:glycosyltransferase involved in cell wall biosynthesis
MRILYVDQTGQMGGGELSLLDVIKHSAHQAEIVLFADGPFRHALEAINVPVHLLSLGKADAIRRESGLASILSGGPSLVALRKDLASLARGFDVIYANSQKAFVISAFARHKGQTLIWHLRDMLTSDHFSSLTRKAAVLAGNFAASAIVMNSEAVRDCFVKAGGKREKTFVVYNGISPAPFEAVQEGDVDRLRSELGLENKFVVGVFGRLTPWKGQHIAIEALSRLPETHLLIVGEALFGEQAYSDDLRALARVLRVEDRVQFLGFHQDISTLMKLTDVVVHSSTAPEPFGRVIVEAMLSNRPVIATRAGGVIEIIEDGKTGLLVEPSSVSELSTAIERLRTDAAFAEGLTIEAKRRAIRAFSIGAMRMGIQQVLTTARASGF